MDKNKTTQEAFKQDLMMAVVFILGSVLISWMLLLSGPRKDLAAEKSKLQSLEQTVKNRKTPVDATPATIKASENANRLSTLGTALGRISSAESAAGIDVETTISKGSIEIEIPADQKIAGKFLTNLLGNIKFKPNGQIINTTKTPFLKLENFNIARKTSSVTVTPTSKYN